MGGTLILLPAVLHQNNENQLFQCPEIEAKLFHVDDILESSETLAIGLEKKKHDQLFQSPETVGLAPSKGWARFQTEF